MQNLIVTNLNDSGTGSLRDAIDTANGDVGTQYNITFQAGLNGTINLSQDFTVAGNIIIDGDNDGDGEGNVIISGDSTGDGIPNVGFFQITSGSSASISNIIMEKGFTTSGSGFFPQDQQLIDNQGTLSMTNVLIRDSRVEGAPPGSGGSPNGGNAYILRDFGLLTLDQVRFEGNEVIGADGDAGGNGFSGSDGGDGGDAAIILTTPDAIFTAVSISTNTIQVGAGGNGEDAQPLGSPGNGGNAGTGTPVFTSFDPTLFFTDFQFGVNVGNSLIAVPGGIGGQGDQGDPPGQDGSLAATFELGLNTFNGSSPLPGAGDAVGSERAEVHVMDESFGNEYFAFGGDDIIIGKSFDPANVVKMYGGDGDDFIIGRDFAEDLFGGAGNDRLFGGDGFDFLFGGAGADYLDGGDAVDRASYIDSNSGVTVDLNAGTSSGGYATGDVLVSIEQLEGSQFNDVLTGTAGNNELFGSDGNDIFRSFSGTDRIEGGSGTDIVDYSFTALALNINLATGKTVRVDGFTGSSGYDHTLLEIEFVRGAQGNDVIRGNVNTDTSIFANGGNDVLIGFNGNDRLVGGTGDDRFNGGAGIDMLFGEAGADQFFATDMMARDQIKDWQDGVDKLNFSAVSSVNSFADINLANGSLGAFVWWDADANGGGAANGFFLTGQSTAIVDASDFIF